MCTFLQLGCISIWEGLSQTEGYTAVQTVDLAACLRITNASKYSQDSLRTWKAVNILEFPYVSALKNPPAVRRCRGHGFNPWAGKITWRRKWQPTPEFLSGKSPGQRSLVDYSPQGCNRVRHGLATKWQKQQFLRVDLLKGISKDWTNAPWLFSFPFLFSVLRRVSPLSWY